MPGHSLDVEVPDIEHHAEFAGEEIGSFSTRTDPYRHLLAQGRRYPLHLISTLIGAREIESVGLEFITRLGITRSHSRNDAPRRERRQ